MIRIVIFLVSILALTSCESELTLQKYFVKHSEDQAFTSFDVSLDLLKGLEGVQSEKAQDAFEHIKKVNYLSLPISNATKSRIIQEQETIEKILNNVDFQDLITYNMNNTFKVTVKCISDGSNIDELIVFMINKEKGLTLARIFGSDMEPKHFYNLVSSVITDVESLDDLQTAFDEVVKQLPVK